MKNWITLEDIYKSYRYKKRDIEGTTVWPPYVKKEDESDHIYALTYRQWYKVIECYFQVVVEKMIQGYAFDMPYRLGKIKLLRADGKKTRGGRLFRNLHTKGFYPMVAWFRHREADFKRKRWYKFNFSRKIVWKKISQHLHANPELIYNFPLNSTTKERLTTDYKKLKEIYE